MEELDKPLYEDKFFSIGSWIYSGIVQFLVGLILSVIVSAYFHWGFGLIIFAIALISSIASYIVFKK